MARRGRNRERQRDDNTIPSDPLLSDPLDTFSPSLPVTTPFEDLRDLVPSPLDPIPDARFFDPTDTVPVFSRLDQGDVLPRAPRRSSPWRAEVMSFRAPKRVWVCIRRKERREVLFAKKRMRGGGGRRRRNRWSDISC